MGAELIGWREKRKPRGKTGTGPIRTGMGMALHTWGGGGGPGKQVSCTINPDGSVELKTATQDLGTGIRTVLAIIAAEILGLKPTDIISNIGNSTFPPGQASGGSTTTPIDGPSVLRRGHQGPRRPLQEDRVGLRQRQARGPVAQGRTALGHGRAGGLMEGRLPQARHHADLGDRLVRPGALQHRRRRLPVRRGGRRHRDRRGQGARRSSPSRTRG